MITCLDNLIGIKRGCGSTTPTSGIYINDPKLGINIKLADAGATDETASGIKLIEEIIDGAAVEFEADIRRLIAPKLKYQSVVESDRIGSVEENLTAVTAYPVSMPGCFWS